MQQQPEQPEQIFKVASSKATTLWTKTSADTLPLKMFVSIVLASIVGGILYCVRPPMVRDEGDVSYQSGAVNSTKILVWMICISVISFSLMHFA